MINFIICEDEKILAIKYKNEIDKFMMQYDIEYCFHMYKGYTADWKKFVQKEIGFKVYLLDIKTVDGSGLDAARYIREELDDWSSMIIIITAYPQYKYDALEKRLMLVDFINKLDKCEEKLREALHICINNYTHRPKSLRYTYKNISYNIELKQINYIEREQDSKKCTVKTTKGDYPIPGSLSKIIKQVDGRFVKCCRSIAVNLDQIESYDASKNVIKFKDKSVLKSISREKKKELLEYVCSDC